MDGRQLCERLHGLVRRATPALTDVMQGGNVVHQGMAVAGQRLVEVAQLWLKRFLVAHDGPDQLAFELLRRGPVSGPEQHRVEAQRFKVGGKSSRGWTACLLPPARICLR